jgi:hypothetical protein
MNRCPPDVLQQLQTAPSAKVNQLEIHLLPKVYYLREIRRGVMPRWKT